MSQGKLEGNRIDTEYYTPSRKDFLDNVWKSHFVKLREIIREWSYWILPPGNSYNDENPITFIRATEMSENLYVDFSNTLKVPEKYYQNKRGRLQKWDILIAVKWATIASKKCIWFIDKEIPESIINGSIFRFQTIEWVNPKYIAYYLDSEEAKKQMKFSLVANNAVDYLNKDVIENLQIPLPSLEVQNQIVENLDKALLEKQTLEAERIETLERIDEYVLWELGIKSPEQKEEKMCFSVSFEEIKNNRFDVEFFNLEYKYIQDQAESNKFEIKEISKVAMFIPWYAFSSKDYKKNWIKLCTIKNIKPYWIDFSDVTFLPLEFLEKYEKFKILNWDLVFAMTWATIWKIMLFKSDEDVLLNQRVWIIRSNKEINNNYLFYFLNTNLFKKQIIKNSVWWAQANISETAIMSIKIPIPPLEIQNKIADEVNNRIREAKNKEQQAKEIYEKAKKEAEEMILH